MKFDDTELEAMIAAGVSIETIKNVERGARFPSLTVLIRICRVLRLEISIQTKNI